MKNLLTALLFFASFAVFGQAVNAPQIPNVSIQRLRTDILNVNIQFTNSGQAMDLAGETFRFQLVEPSSGITRLTLNEGAGITKTGNSLAITISPQQIAALTRDSYKYRLYTFTNSGEITKLYGTFWLVRGTFENVGATLNTSTIVVNYTPSGNTTVTGQAGGPETDPTVSSTVKAIVAQDITNWNASYRTAASVKAALETLTGSARLDASAIKNLPTGEGGGGVMTESDPTVSATVKAITPQDVQAWTTAAASSQNIIFQSNFNIAQADVNLWVNGSSTSSRANGQLIISTVDDAIGFGDYTKYRENQLLYVSIDFVRTGGDVLVSPCYGCGTTSSFLLTATGKYFFTLKRTYTYPLTDYNVVLLQPAAGNTAKSFTLNAVTITDGGAGFSDALPFVKIGAGAAGAYNSVTIGKSATYSASFLDGVAIGTNAKTDQQGGVVVGAEANGMLNTTFGVAGGSDLIAVGYKAKAYGWRTTAIGARSGAAGQSSTVIGAGAFSGISHGVALGRGAFVYGFPAFGTGQLHTGSVIVSDGSQLYFGNGWAHRYNPHPIDDAEYGVNDDNFFPANRTVVLHGHDAYDARTSPSSFNIAGGNLAMMAGRGTGTGAGGKFQVYTAPVASAGQNEKNTPVLALEVDASTTSSDGTRLFLYDLQTSTLKRVKLAPADGNGRKMLYVD